MTERNPRFPAISEEESRAFVLSTIAISTSVFGIAFYYGVFGTVFFDHLFYVWVASTVALVASIFVPPVDALPAFISWRGRFVLILPTIFLFWLFIADDVSLSLTSSGWIEWVLIVGILGLTLPYLLFVLIMVAVPDVERLTTPSLRIAIVGISATVVMAGLLIGQNHYRFISCHDFEVSGNFVPSNCRKLPSF